MADNRLTGGLRGCVEAFLEYIPQVTWPSLLVERMHCALSSQSVLQSLRHSTGFPLRVICTENSGGQVPAGTIQVLARMVPAKALNWLQLAFKCWFYPHRLLQLQTLSQAFLEYITCSRSCLSHQHQVSFLMAAWNYSSSSHDTEIIQPSPETLSSICLQKALEVPWSLTPAGKVPQALTVWAVQGQSAYKCQEMQECQSEVPQSALEESLTGR